MCGWSIHAACELSLLSPEQLSPSAEWLCLSQPACHPYPPTGTGNFGDDVSSQAHTWAGKNSHEPVTPLHYVVPAYLQLVDDVIFLSDDLINPVSLSPALSHVQLHSMKSQTQSVQ